MRALLLVIALASAGCGYEPVPTAPSVVMAPVVVPDAPPIPPNAPLPLAIVLTVGGQMRGRPSYFAAIPLSDTITEPATYVWTFGDGGRAETSAAKTQYTYRAAGLVEPTVVVIDRDGRTAQASTKIQVLAPPSIPPPSPDPPSSPSPPTSSPMTASVSCTAHAILERVVCNVSGTYNGAPVPSAKITNVDWDWGDGTVSPYSNPARDHNYGQAGNYTVIAMMTATTAQGPKTATASITVRVPKS